MDETPDISDDVRAKGQALIERLSDDMSYRETFEANPEQAMAEAGIPRHLMGDLATALVGAAEDPEVEGFNCLIQSKTLLAGPLQGRTVILTGQPTMAGCTRNTEACTIASWYR